MGCMLQLRNSMTLEISNEAQMKPMTMRRQRRTLSPPPGLRARRERSSAWRCSRRSRRRRSTASTASCGTSRPRCSRSSTRTYAFGVLTTLILAGRLSDEVGRRPVLLVALGTLLVDDAALHARPVGRLAVRRPRPAGPRHGRSRSPRPARRCWTCTRAVTRPASASPTASSAPAGSGSACSSRPPPSRRCPRRAWCRTSSSSRCSRSPSSARC